MSDDDERTYVFTYLSLGQTSSMGRVRYMLKKVVLPVIVGLMLLYVGNKTTEALATSDLEKIVDRVFEINPDADVLGWSILARSSTKGSLSVVTSEVKERFTDYVWTEENTSDYQAWTGSRVDEELGVRSTIKVMSNERNEIAILYSIQGEKWSDGHAAYIRKQMKTGKKGLFKNEPDYFACLKVRTGDTMDKVVYKNWMKLFDATSVESAVESDFISISANSKQFENTLPNGVNLQLAFRETQEEEGTTVTIGTPIIAFEY